MPNPCSERKFVPLRNYDASWWGKSDTSVASLPVMGQSIAGVPLIRQFTGKEITAHFAGSRSFYRVKFWTMDFSCLLRNSRYCLWCYYSERNFPILNVSYDVFCKMPCSIISLPWWPNVMLHMYSDSTLAGIYFLLVRAHGWCTRLSGTS